MNSYNNKIKILDCTLRDGGYINNWEFGDNSNIIEKELKKAGIHKIEIGFLTNKNTSKKSTTLYHSQKNLKNKIVMINYGEYNLRTIEDNITVRIAFKKHDLHNLYKELKNFDTKYKFSLNPMHISLYTETELIELCNIANDLQPTCLTAVDTMGIMTEHETEQIFNTLNKNLGKNINLGIHSHDNLGLALKNTITILNMNLNRAIIIDTCLDGIGRGGGMLSTGIIAKYLNKRFNKNYNLAIIDNLAEKFISKYNNYDKYPYYLSAKYKCHPNYAKYLANKNYPYKDIERKLKAIPEANRAYYDIRVIE